MENAAAFVVVVVILGVIGFVAYKIYQKKYGKKDLPPKTEDDGE